MLVGRSKFYILFYIYFQFKIDDYEAVPYKRIINEG